jgi:general secretion pathway protein M
MSRLANLTGQLRTMDPRLRLRLGMGLALLLLVAIVLSAANDRIARLTKKRAAREADIAEMLVLKSRYQEAAGAAQRLANRMAATMADDSPAKVFEEIGIKGKNSQIKPLKGEERPGFVEDAAEIRVEGVSANEMVNLLYRLEKGARPVVIKKALLKTRFDDPARLDLTLTVALLKPAPAGGR